MIDIAKTIMYVVFIIIIMYIVITGLFTAILVVFVPYFLYNLVKVIRKELKK